MLSLRDHFKKYTGFLRNIRLVYVVNNYLNARKLKKNRELYKKAGLKKSVFSSISSKDFKNEPGEEPWLDQPNAKQALSNHPQLQKFDPATQEQLLNWPDQGYIILKNFYSQEEVDKLSEEVNRLIISGNIDFNFGNRIMDAFRSSELIDTNYFRNERMMKLLEFILGQRIHPFQTINFLEGSQQKAHSDFIHMTSEPKGYLIATWTALEDCDEHNGPLFYYPGSHKLPYILSDDFDTGHGKFLLGNNSYKRYEDRIEELIQEHNLTRKYFHAKSGDVLIWHANLLHGGSEISQKGRTRKSMVAHYFCEDVICYHEISERPAILNH